MGITFSYTNATTTNVTTRSCVDKETMTDLVITGETQENVLQPHDLEVSEAPVTNSQSDLIKKIPKKMQALIAKEFELFLSRIKVPLSEGEDDDVIDINGASETEPAERTPEMVIKSNKTADNFRPDILPIETPIDDGVPGSSDSIEMDIKKTKSKVLIPNKTSSERLNVREYEYQYLPSSYQNVHFTLDPGTAIPNTPEMLALFFEHPKKDMVFTASEIQDRENQLNAECFIHQGHPVRECLNATKYVEDINTISVMLDVPNIMQVVKIDKKQRRRLRRSRSSRTYNKS